MSEASFTSIDFVLCRVNILYNLGSKQMKRAVIVCVNVVILLISLKARMIEIDIYRTMRISINLKKENRISIRTGLL
jgi:hypothetical protein